MTPLNNHQMYRMIFNAALALVSDRVASGDFSPLKRDVARMSMEAFETQRDVLSGARRAVFYHGNHTSYAWSRPNPFKV